MDKLQAALDATTEGFERALVRYMPRSPYRGFQLWAAQSPYQEMWAQILGIPQFARLTYFLLNDLVSDADWPRLMNYAQSMNSYLILEAVSDNFASYLQPRDPDSPSQQSRNRLLHTLNDTVITRLQTDATPTSTLLTPANFVVKTLSCFRNSVAQEEQFALAQRFHEVYPDRALEYIEFGGWSVLVANVETCVEVSETLTGARLQPLLKRGLSERYEAVNRLLDVHDLSLAEAIDTSTNAVLVIPYLTYYVSILTEIIQPTDRLVSLLNGDRLEHALYQAALLVRLVNDVGTDLILHEEYRQVLLHQLEYRASSLQTLRETLLELAPELPFLTRFQKDILFGEFNVALNEVGHLPCTPEVVAAFGQTLATLARTYAQNRAALRDQLQSIAAVLGSNAPSKLIGRFVEFHERLYSHPFDSRSGDYATRPNIQAVRDDQ